VSDPAIAVRQGPTYEKDLKKLRLDAESLNAVDTTIKQIVAALTESPNNPDKTRAGDPLPLDSHRTWKRRVGMPGSNVGKRGALRLIYWWRRAEREIVLLFLYYKRDNADVTQKEIDEAKARFQGPSVARKR
jgi:mRNA-degrading endonuclease RelE of RelBE toxin-antitoxin system